MTKRTDLSTWWTQKNRKAVEPKAEEPKAVAVEPVVVAEPVVVVEPVVTAEPKAEEAAVEPKVVEPAVLKRRRAEG